MDTDLWVWAGTLVIILALVVAGIIAEEVSWRREQRRKQRRKEAGMASLLDTLGKSMKIFNDYIVATEAIIKDSKDTAIPEKPFSRS